MINLFNTPHLYTSNIERKRLKSDVFKMKHVFHRFLKVKKMLIEEKIPSKIDSRIKRKLRDPQEIGVF